MSTTDTQVTEELVLLLSPLEGKGNDSEVRAEIQETIGKFFNEHDSIKDFFVYCDIPDNSNDDIVATYGYLFEWEDLPKAFDDYRQFRCTLNS